MDNLFVHFSLFFIFLPILFCIFLQFYSSFVSFLHFMPPSWACRLRKSLISCSHSLAPLTVQKAAPQSLMVKVCGAASMFFDFLCFCNGNCLFEIELITVWFAIIIGEGLQNNIQNAVCTGLKLSKRQSSICNRCYNFLTVSLLARHLQIVSCKNTLS